MKKALSILAVVLSLGLTLGAGDADAARRLGGGKSTGMQRQNVTPAQPPVAPAGSNMQNKSAAPATPATPAATPPKSSWMGPIAGLAAGLGLAALASHFGFGEQLANMMMMGLVVMAVLAVIAFVMRKRAAAANPAMAGAGAPGMQFRGADVNPAPVTGAAGAFSPSGAQQAARVPADFDVAALQRHAKVQFIRLQAANDAGNLDDIREFTTPEMFAEIKMDLTERGAATQHTDVVRVDADVLEVVHEPARYVASVRFTGMIREADGTEPTAFDEVWHLIQFHNIGVWQLAGIQQA